MAISFVKDAKAAQSFLNSPTEFMEQHGIASGSVDTSSPEYAVISALANPEVRNAALTSDPVAFLQAMPEVNSPTLPVIDTVVVGTVYVHLAAVATLSLAAVAVVVVAVVVLVAGAASREAPLQDNTVVSVAGALGGSNFAKDVAGEQARASIAKLIAAIQDGQVKLPDGITPIQAISVLKHSLKKHMIVA